MLPTRTAERPMRVALVCAFAAFAAACDSDDHAADVDGGGRAEGDGGDHVGDAATDAAPEPTSHDPRLVVMTYNVLCATICGIGEYDPWEERIVHFADIFERHDPDLMGLQELSTREEVMQVLDAAPGREAIFFDDGTAWADATIVYRKARFDVVDSGEYWLSPTPDKPRTTGFSGGVQLTRLVVWALLHDKTTDRELYFATTHFDNNSPSQEKSAPLVMERSLPFVKTHPVLVVGDFNSTPDSAAYAILTGVDGDHGFAFVDTQSIATEWSIVTNRDPTPEYDLATRIDHIFVAGEGVTWQVARWQADLTTYGPLDRYPSDHFPIVAELEIE